MVLSLESIESAPQERRAVQPLVSSSSISSRDRWGGLPDARLPEDLESSPTGPGFRTTSRKAWKVGVVVAILSVESLSVHFGVVRALDDVSFSLDEGKLLGLIGPNGAGKTTFIDAATGFASYTGHVVFGGRSLDKLGPHERVWCGMSRTFQSMELFEDLTVRENLRVRAENARRWAMFTRTDSRRGGGSLGLIDSTLEVLGLDDVSSELPSTLPLGVKKLIGVGQRAVIGGKTGAARRASRRLRYQ